jgi:hypothetical protein
MSHALDTVDTEFARVTDTPAERWKKAVNKIQNAGVSLGTSLLPIAERIIGKVTEIADRISNIDFSKFSGTVDKVFQGLEKLVGGIVGIIKMAWNFRYVIIAIVGVMALYHGALMAAALYTKTFAVWQGIAKTYTFLNTLATQGQAAALATLKTGTVAYNVVSKAFTKGEKLKAIATGISTGTITAKTIAMGIATAATGVWATVTGVATAAQTALNVALTANPIGVIIMAVAAVIALLIILIKNFKKITAWVKSNTEKVMLFFTILYGPIGLVISMIKELVSNWQNIKKALSGAGLFDAIKKIGTSIKDFIKPAMDWFIGIWDKVKAAVTGFFTSIGTAVKNFFMPVINWITGIWNAVSSAVVGVFRNIWTAVSTFLEPIFTWISATWQKIVAFFKDNAIVNAIKVIGGTLISGLLAPVQGLLEILSHIPGLGHLAGKGAEKIQEMRNWLKGTDGAATATNATEDVNAGLSPLGESPTASATPGVNYPGLDVPGVGMDAGGERSRLHGVVDVSGGARASIPNFTAGDVPGTYTATQAVSTPSVSVQDTIRTAASEVNSILNEILATAKGINLAVERTQAALEAPATITLTIPPSALPNATRAPYTGHTAPQRNRDGGRSDRERADREDPRNIGPVTREERMAYSLRENRETLGIEVAAAQGTQARIVRRPRSPNIQVVSSGGNG